MHKEYRRVVTGHDENGVAIIESDQNALQILERPNRPGVRLTNFWLTDQTPAEYDGPTETCGGPFILHPSPLGSVFRCVEFMPEDPDVMARLSSEDGAAAFAEMGAGANIVQGGRHPWMHRTDSVDYGIVMNGEIWMLMDNEEDDVLLKAGDVVVQRGTNHAWANRGMEPCTIMFVLIDGVTKNGQGKGIPARS
jgi:quercetin dioxygenase-like cupin family protein